MITIIATYLMTNATTFTDIAPHVTDRQTSAGGTGGDDTGC